MAKKDKIILEVEIEETKAEKDLKKIEKAQQAYMETLSETGKTLREIKRAHSESAKVLKLQEQLARSTAGSYNALSAQYSLNVLKLNQMSKAERLTSAEGIKLTQETKEIRNSMNEMQKSVGNTALEVGNYKENIKDAWDELKKGNKPLKNVGEISKNSFKALGKESKAAFKSVGVGIKASGLALLLGLLKTLWEAIKQNQTIMDAFQNAVNALGIVMKPVVDAVSSLVKGVMNGSKEFDSLGKVLKGLITIALLPLKTAFYTLELAVLGLEYAWYKVTAAFGSNTAKKELEVISNKIAETTENLKEAAKDGANAVKDVVTNSIGAVGELTNLSIKTVKNVSKAVVSVYKGQASAMTEAKKSLELLDAQQDKIKEKREAEAELQRQIRDDESRSIAERIEANNKLAEIITKQREEELDIVNQKIKAQKLLMQNNPDNIEYQKTLSELENQRLEINNRITGQLSEQMTNINSLKKENKDLLQSKKDYFAELDNIIKERDATEEGKELLKADIEKAEQVSKLEELKLNEEEKTKALALLEEVRQKQISDIKNKYAKIYAEKDKKEKDSQNKREEELNRNKINAASKTFENASYLLGKESKAGRLASIAQTTIDTYQSAQAAYKAMAGIPIVGPALGAIAAATAVKMGIENVSRIKQQKFATGGIVSGTSYAGDNINIGVNSGEMVLNQQQQARLFDQINNNNIGVDYERLGDVLASKLQDQRVYVLESDITTTQQRVSVRESEFVQ